MARSTLIINGSVVRNVGVVQQDILIEGSRIKKIGKDLQHLPADEIIDAKGLHIFPGMIDDQVHFREPGLTHKGRFATESRAALAGGITSVMEMPNTNPQTVSREALATKYAMVKDKSFTNYDFYMGATLDNIDEVRQAADQPCCGIKIFMGASTGNMLVDKPKVLEAIFADSPLITLTHCEDTPMIQANEKIWREKFGDDVPAAEHPNIRSRQACYKSSSWAVDLAKRFGTKLHVLHLTTAEELALFDVGPVKNKQITAEVCVHHLYFNSKDYEQLGHLIKCNPAIKNQSDQLALQAAVNNDRIDVIATDHAPHTWEEKQNSYFSAPSGLPLVQQCLPALLELYHDQVFSLEKIVEKTTTSVRDLYNIQDRGLVEEGFYADLCLINLNKPEAADKNIAYACGWTPFAGRQFRSSVFATFVNGHQGYREGQWHDRPMGQILGARPYR